MIGSDLSSLDQAPLASLSVLMPLVLFTLVNSLTPGPNNVMLASSGLTFGFRRTIPTCWGSRSAFRSCC